MSRYEYKTVGQRLKELRKEKKIKQKDLAKMLNTTKSAISNWETGYNTPKPDSLKDLANIFNVTVDYLLESMDNNIVRDTNSIGGYKIEYDHVKLDFIKQISGKDYFAKVMYDSSMNLVINKDDIMVASKKVIPDNNDIVIVKKDKKCCVRRYTIVGNDVVLTAESSSNQFAPMVIKNGDKQCKIIGKVEYIISNMK